MFLRLLVLLNLANGFFLRGPLRLIELVHAKLDYLLLLLVIGLRLLLELDNNLFDGAICVGKAVFVLLERFHFGVFFEGATRVVKHVLG